VLERLGTTFIVLVVYVPIRNIKAVCVCTNKFTATKILTSLTLLNTFPVFAVNLTHNSSYNINLL